MVSFQKKLLPQLLVSVYLTVIATTLVSALTGCSDFSSASSSAGSSLGLSSAAATGTTVLIPTQQNLFSSYSAQVQTPASSSTILIYARPRSVLERQNLLPVNPQAANLNSSQQLVYTVAATEHCRDLVTAEASIVDSGKATRKFFKTQNLAAGSALATAGEYQAAAAALGRAFWRREPSDEEQSLFSQMYSEFSGQSLSNQNLFISLCNVELASASSIVH